MTPTPEQLRKIDAVIAEKVMGWDVIENSDWLIGRPRGHGTTEYVPRFTTDPAASKQVREKLAERWTILKLTLCPNAYTTKIMFEVGMYGHRRERFREFAETEELAVCLCALKSIGVEVAEILGGER